MELPDDLLERSAEEGARRVILAMLSEARAASERLPDAMDGEALHDFRVAIRRTRSALRAWAALLPDRASKKLRGRLTKIQQSTGAARDAEVALSWLANLEKDIGVETKRGVGHLSALLEAERSQTMDAAVEELQARFARACTKLEQAVAVMTVEIDLRGETSSKRTFAEALAERARTFFSELSDLLSGVTGPQDAERMHESRIAGKRLRYLLEPVRPYEPEAVHIVKRLKKLQDVLGDINDAHVLSARVADERTVVADFTLRTALDAVRARALSRAYQLHRKLESDWLKGGLAELGSSVDELARALEAHRDLEVERKYLLSRMPELPPGAETVEIEQGYLPGRRFRERVRRIRREGSTEYYRTIKLGKGVERFELEEETTREVFDTLWTLTEGCRIRKRRHVIVEGTLTWEIDEFLDRDLVLAEVELHSRDEHPAVPAWLQPAFVEEVTERGEYTNLALAR